MHGRCYWTRKGFQSGLPPCPLYRATQRPPRGQSSQPAAMEVICLVVTAQQVSPGAGGGQDGWDGEGAEAGLSKHLTRQEKKTAPQASVSGMSSTHGHSLTHHTHVTTTRVYPQFRPGARSRYRCLLLGLWQGGRRVAAPFLRENAEGRENSGNNKHGHRGRTACCLFSFACHTNFFPPLPGCRRSHPGCTCG